MNNTTVIPEAMQALIDLVAEKEQRRSQLSRELAEVVSEHTALRHVVKLVLSRMTSGLPLDEREMVQLLSETLAETEAR